MEKRIKFEELEEGKKYLVGSFTRGNAIYDGLREVTCLKKVPGAVKIKFTSSNDVNSEKIIWIYSNNDINVMKKLD